MTSVERYHLADDSPRHPNVIACELLVRGPLDPDAATLALRETAARHPLVCATLESGSWRRRPRWRLDLHAAARMNWRVASGSVAAGVSPDFIDLAAPGQLSGEIVRTTDGELTRLSFRAHHAAVDGGGGLQFVADWITGYHRIQSNRAAPPPPDVNETLLDRRNRLGLLNREFLSRLWIQPIAVLGAMKFVFRKVTPLIPRGEAPIAGRSSAALPSEPRLLSLAVEHDDVNRLRRAARDRSVTLNDLILRAVFLAMHELRREHQWYRSREWLRVVIPVSIRDFSDRRMPAANRASIVQLDRRERDFADPDGLLAGINYELGNIRRWNLEKTFLLILRGMSVVPGWISRTAARPVCRATTVVTNLGAPFARIKLPHDDEGRLCFGNLLLEDVDLVLPLRPYTATGLAVVNYARRLKINLHFDPSVIPRAIARELLRRTGDNLFIERSAAGKL